MQIRETDDAGLPVIHISGEVDLHGSPDLRSVLQRFAKMRPAAIALDLSEVTYIDSSGLATIVEYVRSSHAFSGRIALAGLNPRVKTIFDLVRLGEILPIVATLADARDVLGVPPA